MVFRRELSLSGKRTVRVVSLSLAAVALAVTPNNDLNAADPTVQEALEAPAPDLAQSYLYTNYMLERVLPYAESGVVGTIHVGGEEITARNASKYKRRYKKRKKIYGEAIRQRGQTSLAGTYSGEATESCERVKSHWISAIASGMASSISINQDGVDATLEIVVMREGESLTLNSKAAVVESSIAVGDQVNPDYYSLGEATDGKVTIRPDVRVLTGWPDWAAPPKREDIIECSVELTPLGQAATTE
jgi:hypothetical protein